MIIVKHCYKAQQWNSLIDNVIRISAVCNQSQQILIQLVHFLESIIEEIDDVNVKSTLIRTLQTVRRPNFLPCIRSITEMLIYTFFMKSPEKTLTIFY